MRWLPLVIVLVALRADASPVRIDFDDIDFPVKKKPLPACKPTADWTTFQRCNLKDFKIELLHDLPGAKLVSIMMGSDRERRQLALYVLSNKTWLRASVYVEVNASSELLAFAPLGDSYRIDLAFASSTWVSLDEVSSRPAMLRRTYTYVCDRNGACHSVTSSCDLFVHGKALATFRGEVKWDGRSLKLRGDGRNTNRYCVLPGPHMMETE